MRLERGGPHLQSLNPSRTIFAPIDTGGCLVAIISSLFPRSSFGSPWSLAMSFHLGGAKGLLHHSDEIKILSCCICGGDSKKAKVCMAGFNPQMRTQTTCGKSSMLRCRGKKASCADRLKASGRAQLALPFRHFLLSRSHPSHLELLQSTQAPACSASDSDRLRTHSLCRPSVPPLTVGWRTRRAQGLAGLVTKQVLPLQQACNVQPEERVIRV